jgi:hypothetical protein
MNEAQYLLTRSQHYYARARETEDAKAKKAFEVLATELWFKATVLSRQDWLVERASNLSQCRNRSHVRRVVHRRNPYGVQS